MNQRNGNEQLNGARKDVNQRVERLKGLGSTRRIAWGHKRRYRSI